MRSEKTLNNKGFSLVELIIVISIMAILIGVMAPNLMRYVERTNVSADTQLADSLRTVIMTSMMDPNVPAADVADFRTRHGAGAAQLANASFGATGTNAMLAEINQSLNLAATDGANLHALLVAEMRSRPDGGAITINIELTANNNVVVTLINTSSTGVAGGPDITVG